MSPLMLAANLIARFHGVIDSFAGTLSATILDALKDVAGQVAACLVTAYSVGAKSLLQVFVIADHFESVLNTLLHRLAAGAISLLEMAAALSDFLTGIC